MTGKKDDLYYKYDPLETDNFTSATLKRLFIKVDILSIITI